MTQIGFYFDQTRCTGCFTCAVACKDWHDIQAGPINWIRVISIERGEFPKLFLTYLTIACNHCADPECGFKCLKVCIWDSPQFSNELNSKMEKCDLCLDRLERGQQTICVEACPMYALDVGPMEKLQEKHGNIVETEGFLNNDKIKPSIIFKPKMS